MKSLLVTVISSLLGLVLTSLAAAQQLPQANQPSQVNPAHPYQGAAQGTPSDPFGQAGVGHPQPQALYSRQPKPFDRPAKGDPHLSGQTKTSSDLTPLDSNPDLSPPQKY